MNALKSFLSFGFGIEPALKKELNPTMPNHGFTMTKRVSDTPPDSSRLQAQASSPKNKTDDKKDRLAQALRDNLKRRKAQTRARKSSGENEA